ncbi:recombinase family protein [Streptomyces sp. WMMC940]|uniref:recombinase family protein n=1 Tax=Streptomyces sp. WMMC940 TaxID=3015153 RepID=UPI003FCCCE50
MKPPVGAHTRLSEVGEIGEIGDGRDGREGVEHQREDAAEIAASRGLRIHRVYEDNDLSAYKRNVKRPEFQQLLKIWRAGDPRHRRAQHRPHRPAASRS